MPVTLLVDVATALMDLTEPGFRLRETGGEGRETSIWSAASLFSRKDQEVDQRADDR